jgi:integrase
MDRSPGVSQGHRPRWRHVDARRAGPWLAVALDDRDAGVWVLASTTGMRRSELAGVDRNRLDLDGATLEIADTRVVVDGRPTTRTARARRVGARSH